ncbi:MAG: nucleotidyl transferase AbiEii/AbiGii toxin family protein [Acidimicrobiaceae bacterium]|nr:nucleotidyl transferase AbiEii/AbiGii toxin family protein [Acidimicrobiaceae bacterium]
MIPLADHDHWRTVIPWSDPLEIEQDLVLARLMVDVAQHEALQGKLAFKGGTCLHKLWMPEPWRYSEDLDYTSIGDVEPGVLYAAFKEIGLHAGFTGMEWRLSDHASGLAHATLIGEFLDGSPFYLKIDVQMKPGEPPPLLRERLHTVDTAWFQGEASVLAFTPEEILASKVAAAYGRRKPRDIFDIWAALQAGITNPEETAERFCRYKPETWTSRLFAKSLVHKLSFEDYMDDLVSNLGERNKPNASPQEVVRRTAELVDACTEATVPQKRWRYVLQRGGTAVEGLKDWAPPPVLRPARSRSAQPTAARIQPSKPKNKKRATKRTPIIAALKRDPKASYSEIAASVGASSSYVAQIARERGLQR